MVVQHNLQAMNANRMFGITQSALSSSTEKLSSGYKINRAADNTAGLAISEKMRKQIRGLTQASANAEDGISSVQTAEGALQEVTDMLQRMNELVVQAANGTNSTSDRSFIQNEVDQLITEIDRVAETTKFNEMYLLKGDSVKNAQTFYTESYAVTYTKNMGSNTDLKYKVNYNETKTLIFAAVADFDDEKDGARAQAVSAKKGDDITQYIESEATGTGKVDTGKYTAFTAASNKDQVQDLDIVDGKIAADGDTFIWDKESNQVIKVADQSDMSAYLQNVELSSDGTTVEYAQMKDGYMMLDPNEVTGVFVVDDQSEQILYDSEGNVVSGVRLRDYFNRFGIYTGGLFTDMTGAPSKEVASDKITEYVNSLATTVAADLTFSLHVGADSFSKNKIVTTIQSMSAASLGINALKGSQAGIVDTSGQKATDAIDVVADALQKVSTQRSALGAVQNRLEHTIKNLDNVVENTTSAESAIRDTDMATEMVRYSNANILSQAGQSMLAQANQANQGVLSLLG